MPWGILRGTRSLVVQVGVCLALVKVAGAVKVLAMARAFGASDSLDAFLAAFLLPSFLGETIAGSLTPALVPVLIGARASGGIDALHQLIRDAAALLVTVLCGFALLLLAFSPLLLIVLGSGYSESKRMLTLQLLVALLPIIPLSGLSIVWRASLNASDHFVLAALAPGFTPVLSSILLFAVSGVSIQMLAWATLAGLSLEVLTLGVAMHRAGLPWLPSVRAWWRSSAIRVTAREHLRLMSVAAIGNGSLLADQSAAAMIGAGSVSALNYGTRLVTVLAGVAGGALSTVALPRFARLAQHGDWPRFRAMLRKYMVAVLAVALPLALLIGVAAPDLVRVLFLRGAFTEESAALVTAVQRISAWQLPALTVNALLFRVLSSMQANTVVVRIAAVTFACNALGDFVLARFLGVPGVAAAGVAAQTLMLICLSWSAWATIRRQA